eukprot:m.187844 g.187844  ORF g.187844 m.187844 type:complete len:52 (+) comp18170_c1_seq1:74-229(+)
MLFSFSFCVQMKPKRFGVEIEDLHEEHPNVTGAMLELLPVDHRKAIEKVLG